MFLVLVEYINSNKMIQKLIGTTPELPVNGQTFTLTVTEKTQAGDEVKFEFGFGEVLEQREIFGRIMFRTPHEVYELKVLKQLPRPKVLPANVISFSDVKKLHDAKLEGALLLPDQLSPQSVGVKVDKVRELMTELKKLEKADNNTISVMQFINKDKYLSKSAKEKPKTSEE